jgi:hypothetical protein
MEKENEGLMKKCANATRLQSLELSRGQVFAFLQPSFFHGPSFFTHHLFGHPTSDFYNTRIRI